MRCLPVADKVLRMKREEAADNALQVKVRYHGCGKEDPLG